MKFWTVVSGIISGIFLIDMVSWIVSGSGIVQLAGGGGQDNPLVIAIAEHVTTIPDWAFWIVCAASVVVLSAIMMLSVVSSCGGPKKCRRTMGWKT